MALSKAEVVGLLYHHLINNKYIPYSPTEKQLEFILSPEKDVFFGGACGGAKSWALLMSALLFVDIPGYNAILIRDTFRNLDQPNGLMDIATQWLTGTDAHPKDGGKKWVFPSGASLNFGYLDGPRDHYNYQGSAFQFVGIDEIVNIRKEQALYLFSRMRKIKGSDVPVRFRAASNPPTGNQIAIGAWVKERYVDLKTRLDGTLFIPSRMQDNPHLDIVDYQESLMNLDPITRKQLAEGDWEIHNKGQLFDRTWFGVVDQLPQNIVKTVRYWDLAGTSVKKQGHEPCYTSGTKMSISSDGVYYIESIIRTRKEPLHVEQLIRQTADLDGKRVHIYQEEEPGSSGKAIVDHYRRNVLPDFVYHADKVSGNKLDRAAPLSSQAEAGNVKLIKGAWNADFLDEIELFPDGQFKDQVDSTSGAFNILSSKRGHFRCRSV